MLAALTAVVLASAMPSAQTQAPAAPAVTPQQQNDEILKELRAIRLLLERLTTVQPPQAAQPPPQPTTAKVTNLKGYVLGKPDAPLTMVEFTDLQCPFCRQFSLTSFDEIKKNWIDTASSATSAATSRSTFTRRRCPRRGRRAAPASKASSGKCG